MARYGDLDAVKLKVQRYLIPNTDDDGTVRVEDAERWFLKLLDEEPTADVAPKSEVAREIFAEIEDIIKSPHTVGFNLIAPLKEALKEYNEGIRKERLYYINKLKKKYTEDEE